MSIISERNFWYRNFVFVQQGGLGSALLGSADVSGLGQRREFFQGQKFASGIVVADAVDDQGSHLSVGAPLAQLGIVCHALEGHQILVKRLALLLFATGKVVPVCNVKALMWDS